MAEVTVEIVGLEESESRELLDEYGDRVEVKTILLDDEMPDRIRELIEERHPPSPDSSWSTAGSRRSGGSRST